MHRCHGPISPSASLRRAKSLVLAILNGDNFSGSVPNVLILNSDNKKSLS